MAKEKAETSEKLFQEGYKLLNSEPSDTLTTTGAFLKPLNKAAKMKNPKASFLLGYLLCTGYKDLTVDVEKGNKVLKRCFHSVEDLALNGHDYQAIKFLSEYYRIPLAGHVRDDDKAKSLLSLAESYHSIQFTQPLKNASDDASSQNKEENAQPDAAVSAKAGDSVYDRLVSAISELNDSGSYDTQEKLNTIKKSADEGNIRAAIFLGSAYEDGRYVIKDIETSRLYYLKAEELGSVKAKYRLGVQEVNGEYTHKDLIQGLNRIYQAAKAGLPDAQFFLGRIYYEGKLFSRDTSKAYFYFQAASARGYKEADNYLKIIEAESGDRALLAKN